MKTLKEFSSKVKTETKNSEIKESQDTELLEAKDLSSYIVEKNQPLPHEMDPPAMLVMRRKQIRQFSNNQRVALYYVDKINKYVTVPYTAMQWSAGSMPEGVQLEDEMIVDVINQLEKIVEEKTTQSIQFNDGKTIRVDEKTARLVLKTYNSLNLENKNNFSKMINENKEQFGRVVDFAWKHSK